MHREQQSTPRILMIRPAAFGVDTDCAATNHFQQDTDLDPKEIQRRALAEFDAAVYQLDAHGVQVHVFNDSAFPVTPSAIFPNNWFSTHGGDTVVIYPMLAESRRAENDPEVFAFLDRAGFDIDEYIDMSLYEAEDRALEGTGSMVLDRVNGQVFACLSPRTDLELLETFGQELDFFPIPFHAVDAQGRAIYHTNVMLAIGTEWAIVCAEAIRDVGERKRVLDGLDEQGREVIEISFAQMDHFAANVIELRNRQGNPLIVLSERALASLREDQKAILKSKGELLTVAVPTIQDIGGGGIRCMIAELFLNKK